MLLSAQFTQSALDCMSVEVGRLRAFLQVRAHLDRRGSFLSLALPFPRELMLTSLFPLSV